MTDITNLNELRANKANNNALWTPIECAEAFVRDVHAGKVKPTRLVILYEEEEPGGGKAFATYLANVQRDTEIAMLHTHLHSATHRWIKP